MNSTIKLQPIYQNLVIVQFYSFINLTDKMYLNIKPTKVGSTEFSLFRNQTAGPPMIIRISVSTSRGKHDKNNCQPKHGSFRLERIRYGMISSRKLL